MLSRTRFRTRTAFLSLAIFWGISLTPNLDSHCRIHANEAFEQDPDQFQKLATEAYIFGYPLVLMDQTRQVAINVPTVIGGAPINQFAHLLRFPDPTFRFVVSPNADTLYSSGWLDLSKEPIILQVPDTQDRYYLMPIMDCWSNVFSVPGKRTTGTKPAEFGIVGPKWNGMLPAGVREIRAPTNYVWVVGRTQTNGAADYSNVHSIQQGYRLTPLSAYGREYQPPRLPVDLRTDLVTPPVKQVERMDCATFFSRFAKLLRDNPPSHEDQPLVSRIQRIGIAPNGEFDFDRYSATQKEALDAGVTTGRELIKQPSPAANIRQKHGWAVQLSAIGNYGTNYQSRAYVARRFLAVIPPEDSVYPHTEVDADGRQLHGSNRYEIRFPKGSLPPANAFWSLTMYDMDQFFVPNRINRYAIGDRDSLKFEADGSLRILIQHEFPGDEHVSNWLPAPNKEFNLMMRIYWPKPSVIEGEWMPPPVTRLNAVGG